MKAEFATVFRKVPEGYIGFVEEFPGAITHGRSSCHTRAPRASSGCHTVYVNRGARKVSTVPRH